METRLAEEGDTIRRRRQCVACEKRFTTYERVELSMPVIVKRGGGRAETEVGVERAARDEFVGRTRVDERGELGQRSGNAAFVVDRTGGFGDDEWIGIV